MILNFDFSYYFIFFFISFICVFYFFFSSRRRHTRYIGDWSSDVCSSDLTVCPTDITINDLLSGVTVGPGDNTTQKQNSYQLADTFAWTRGKHNFKFGGRSEERRVGKECRSQWSTDQ